MSFEPELRAKLEELALVGPGLDAVFGELIDQFKETEAKLRVEGDHAAADRASAEIAHLENSRAVFADHDRLVDEALEILLAEPEEEN